MKIGVSMSGGSTGCIAYASFLETLKTETGLQPDMYAGLSGGAIVAPMLSAGFTSEEIADIFAELKFHKLVNLNLKNLELVDHHKLIEYFRNVLPVKKLEELPTPVIVFASDVKQQRTEVIDKGDIASAMVASSSIFPLLNPIRRLGKFLTDGGFSIYYGVEHLKERGMDRVIGVDVTGMNEGTTPKYFQSLFLSVNTALARNKVTELQNFPPDLDVQIKLQAPSFFNIQAEKNHILDLGRKAAFQHVKQIEHLQKLAS